MPDTTRKNVIIYTDGACSGNPGPGGWGCVLMYGNHRKEMSGFMPDTTNNRMELFAAISALGALKEPCNVALYSDSTYLVKAFEEHWIDNWKKQGFRRSDGTQVPNSDLWFILMAQTKKHQVRFIHVKGHASNEENNRCDELARAAIAEYRDINSPHDDEGNLI
ncbi:MAG: ribonuclease HI [Clostridia bacterium]|nr:ribonuclease HI [Clostridia bacterium]